jgi:nucleoid-associated protein YgaU
MDPNLALPSYRVYRGSLLALLVGSVFAVWLLVLPPDGADSDGPPAALAGVLPRATPIPTSTPELAPTPAVAPTSTPGGVAAGPTPSAPDPTATPAPTVASGVAEEYIVQPGDLLSLIAERFLTPGGDIDSFFQHIVDLNGIADPSNIAVGQVIAIPTQ